VSPFEGCADPMRKLTGFAGALQVDCVQRSVAAAPRGKRDAVILIRPQRRKPSRASAPAPSEAETTCARRGEASSLGCSRCVLGPARIATPSLKSRGLRRRVFFSSSGKGPGSSGWWPSGEPLAGRRPARADRHCERADIRNSPISRR
jgi:hypothetical protein